MTKQSHAQGERQEHRDRKSGRYSEFNPCYRCGKSAGAHYWSHLCDEADSLGNEWHDGALCICEPCAHYLQALPAAEAWAELMSENWGSFPRPRKKRGA